MTNTTVLNKAADIRRELREVKKRSRVIPVERWGVLIS